MSEATGLHADYLVDIRRTYRNYRKLAESAIAQLTDEQFLAPLGADDNSIAIIMQHVAGNLQSRFRDFLTSDGEKPWRKRESEFERRSITKAELLDNWSAGWTILLDAIGPLTDAQLHGTVMLRGQPFLVHEALLRSLAHVAYHTGQIVYIAKSIRGTEWRYLSIPPGQSDAYNQNPALDRAGAHSTTLSSERK